MKDREERERPLVRCGSCKRQVEHDEQVNGTCVDCMDDERMWWVDRWNNKTERVEHGHDSD